MNLKVRNFNIELSGDLAGVAEVTRASNTTIQAEITAQYVRYIYPDGVTSGLSIAQPNGASANVAIGLDYTHLDTVYAELAGATFEGNVFAPRYYDSDDNNYFLDPASETRLNTLRVGYGLTFSSIGFADGVGSQSTLYASGGKIGFLDNTFNYAAYSERSTGNWVVQNGDVRAERFVDADATTFFIHPGGSDSNIKALVVENNFRAGDVYIDTREITTGTGDLSINAFTNEVDFNANRLKNIADPVSIQDVASKGYVDSVAQGLRVIPAAIAATTVNIAGTYNHGAGTITIAATPILEIDGVSSWVVGDRILVKDQTASLQNGSYEFSTIGSGSTAWVLTRGEYFNETVEIPGAFQFVTDGTDNNGTGWVATVTDAETFVLGTDDVVWQQFSGAGTYSAGDAITLTGTQFSIVDGDITNAKLENSSFTVIDEFGASQVITLGTNLTFTGTDGVDVTVTAGQIAIAINEIDGGTF
tara:strand:- start:38 stop:1462 length:1425 start_codon:yes stop_codon:yes gene_type:complete